MISQPNDIEMILDQAHEQKWPFLQQFEALKHVGVTSYEVVPATYNLVFYGTFGIWRTRQAPDTIADVTAATEFNQEALLQALNQRMEKKSTYVEFLQHIAHAGIDRYVVDMADRTVTYYGIDEEHYYVQYIP